jgi:hypothetical protein
MQAEIHVPLWHERTGRIVDPVDERDYMIRSFAPRILETAAIRWKLSYRHRLGPVLDQLTTPKCVTHSAAVVKTFLERLDHRRTYHFDPHYLYDLCKQRDGIPHLDGTYVRVVLDVMKDIGAGRVGKDFVADAPRFKVDAYARLTSFDDVVQTLSAIGPCIAGIDWLPDWFEPYQNRLATPSFIPTQTYGHAIAFCGYDLTSNNPSGEPEIEIRNSWGQWADAGHAFMPKSELERQLALPRHLSADVWSVVDAKHRGR